MSSKLVIAGRGNLVLQAREQVLNHQMARPIAMPVDGSRAALLRTQRNDPLGTGLSDGLNQRICVVSLAAMSTCTLGSATIRKP